MKSSNVLILVVLAVVASILFISSDNAKNATNVNHQARKEPAKRTDWTMTIERAIYNGEPSEVAQGRWMRIDVTIENASMFTMGTPKFVLMADAKVFSTMLAPRNARDSISPGLSQSYVLYFDVPDKLSKITLLAANKAGTGNVTVSVGGVR